MDQTPPDDCQGQSKTTMGSQPVEPLTAVEWQFPLGAGVARLTIVVTKPGEIVPEDMDALREMAALIKRQLQRRKGEAENNPLVRAAAAPDEDRVQP